MVISQFVMLKERPWNIQGRKILQHCNKYEHPDYFIIRRTVIMQNVVRNNAYHTGIIDHMLDEIGYEAQLHEKNIINRETMAPLLAFTIQLLITKSWTTKISMTKYSIIRHIRTL